MKVEILGSERGREMSRGKEREGERGYNYERERERERDDERLFVCVMCCVVFVCVKERERERERERETMPSILPKQEHPNVTHYWNSIMHVFIKYSEFVSCQKRS